MSGRVIRSTPKVVSPVWGGRRLASVYGKGGEGVSIGETWEVWGANPVVGSGARLDSVVDLPLLVKLLDTSEKLSVQVHPDDTAARRLEGAANGKAEGWVVLHAEPGARIAYGLAREMSVDELRERALSGALEEDLGWREVRAGEVIDVPPGTIHAIGGGLTLYEIQQPSDLTYRLFDYGRGRELHLEKSLQVAVRRPMDGTVAPRAAGPGRWELLRSPSFVVERLEVPAARAWSGGPAALTVVAGDLRVGGEPVRLGETVVVEGPVELGGAGDVLVGRSA